MTPLILRPLLTPLRCGAVHKLIAGLEFSASPTTWELFRTRMVARQMIVSDFHPNQNPICAER